MTILSPSAAQDLAAIYPYTAQKWGYYQAERYADLIEKVALEAAEPETKHAHVVEGKPEYSAIMVKWKRAKHSHYVVFRRTEYGAEIVRILHSVSDHRKVHHFLRKMIIEKCTT